MNSAHKSVILAALLLAPVAVLNGADSPSGKPNVIIVLTDDQGYGDLSGTGNPVLKTPHLDRLAAEGVASRISTWTLLHADACRADDRPIQPPRGRLGDHQRAQHAAGRGSDDG